MSAHQDTYAAGDFNVDISEQINEVIRDIAGEVMPHFGLRRTGSDEVFDADGLWISVETDTEGLTLGRQFSLQAELLAPGVFDRAQRLQLAIQLRAIAVKLEVSE